MAGGAPLGNTNAAGRKSKPFAEAIERALMKRGKVDQAEALLQVANTLIEKAEEGDMAAIKELADRLDGKAVQQIAGNIGFTDLSEAELDRRIEQLESQLKG